MCGSRGTCSIGMKRFCLGLVSSNSGCISTRNCKVQRSQWRASTKSALITQSDIFGLCHQIYRPQKCLVQPRISYVIFTSASISIVQVLYNLRLAPPVRSSLHAPNFRLRGVYTYIYDLNISRSCCSEIRRVTTHGQTKRQPRKFFTSRCRN